jgi:hypothetical protein
MRCPNLHESTKRWNGARPRGSGTYQIEASDEPATGLAAFVATIETALAWDFEAMRGALP